MDIPGVVALDLAKLIQSRTVKAASPSAEGT